MGGPRSSFPMRGAASALVGERTASGVGELRQPPLPRSHAQRPRSCVAGGSRPLSRLGAYSSTFCVIETPAAAVRPRKVSLSDFIRALQGSGLRLQLRTRVVTAIAFLPAEEATVVRFP